MFPNQNTREEKVKKIQFGGRVKGGGNGGGKAGENVGFTEEVGHSVSEEILPPAYKRFNSSSPLITLSDPAEAVKKCRCVCAHVCLRVCNTLYTEKNER